jgi:hypothetical protein
MPSRDVTRETERTYPLAVATPLKRRFADFREEQTKVVGGPIGALVG